MKQFTFNANTVTQLQEHWTIKKSIAQAKVKAGWNTLYDRAIFTSRPEYTIIDQLTNEVMIEAYYQRKITKVSSMLCLSKKHNDIQSFGLLSLYAKNKVACMPKDIAFEIVRLYDEEDPRAIAFATAAKNWYEIEKCVRSNKDTLSEYMDKYDERKKAEAVTDVEHPFESVKIS